MAESLIDQALRGASETRGVVIGDHVLDQTGPLFTKLFSAGTTAVIVADDNTYGVAGAPVEQSLQDSGVQLASSLILPGTPTVYASYENVVAIREHLAASDALAVVVGAGTLNDLVKLASAELGREYICVATAASVDGYASFGASITVDGFKRSIDCPAPAGLVLDLPVMAGAPAWLTATGYGDLIEKLTGGADWILADAVGIEAIDHDVWPLVQEPLRDALSRPADLAAGDPEAIDGLSQGLVMSGLAMQAYKTSRPASGSGHHFSHLWEMERLGMDRQPPLSHGLKVGLGTVAATALWEVAMTRDLAALDIDAAVAKWPSWEQVEAQIRAQLSGRMLEPSLEQSRAKYIEPDALAKRLRRVADTWPQVVAQVREQLIPAGEVQQMLDAVGAYSLPSQVGLDTQRFRDSHLRSNMIRSRYTVTDLLFEAGLLEGCVDELFAPDGFWGRQL